MFIFGTGESEVDTSCMVHRLTITDIGHKEQAQARVTCKLPCGYIMLCLCSLVMQDIIDINFCVEKRKVDRNYILNADELIILILV